MIDPKWMEEDKGLYSDAEGISCRLPGMSGEFQDCMMLEALKRAHAYSGELRQELYRRKAKCLDCGVYDETLLTRDEPPETKND